MAYKGRYTPKNKNKYNGNINDIVFRSLWERNLMRWCDRNDEVVMWNSESIAIPYRCATDNRMHRYFIDFAIKFTNGKSLLVEVKPNKETKKPVGGRGKKFLTEQLKYAKNMSKWNAAKEFADSNGWTFCVWTENELRKLGIKVL